MTNTQPVIILPQGFDDLAPFLNEWCLKGQVARYDKLIASSIAEVKIFYDAVLPRIDAIVDHLNRFEVDGMPASEQALFDLALTFAEVAHPVDFQWKATEFEDLFPVKRIVFSGPSLAW